jgi:hypothetical protein
MRERRETFGGVLAGGYREEKGCGGGVKTSKKVSLLSLFFKEEEKKTESQCCSGVAENVSLKKFPSKGKGGKEWRRGGGEEGEC